MLRTSTLTTRAPLKRSRLNPKRKKPASKVRIDYAQFEFGKRVTQPKPSIIHFEDGREVCNLRTPGGFDEYRRRTKAMLDRQASRCALGGELINFMQATFDHGNLRGLGGSLRDDRIEILDADGAYANNAVCFEHNTKRGSKRNVKFAVRTWPKEIANE